jgi:hypothetical protein
MIVCAEEDDLYIMMLQFEGLLNSYIYATASKNN